ncbi:MAG: DivIVA domain-containing protein [Alkalibacterium gilvum]|uniref:Cell division initiation protein n=1 Tax=Alkalibacterium gilvum TaxID=1130080 RepID=A0A1H6U2B0_9LACT|nr:MULTISPECIES: DivIVA domain-containing protein [Alkalibacterium]SEI82550.1 cell division initiation protein [Alkalibacterium gilvum]HAJ69759.1 DivIVA domain-containing protein [Alkalibacterium sp.]
MALTPMDIHNKEFPVRMRGYDQDEVNDYFDQIIKDYEMLLKQKKETEKKLDISEEKLKNYDQMHDSLNKSILVAQEAADRLKLNAEKEAEMIDKEANTKASNLMHEAENNADELLKEAVSKARKIEQETEELRKQSRIFRQRLQLMIESQLELVKKEEWDDILQPPLSDEAEIETIKEVKKELDEKDEETGALNIEEDLTSSDKTYEDNVSPAAE